MARQINKLALKADDPGEDPVMAKDATACHFNEMFCLVEGEIEERKYRSADERDRLVEMRSFWGSALDRRLGQLANGHRPSKVRLPNPDGHPSVLAAFREAFSHHA